MKSFLPLAALMLGLWASKVMALQFPPIAEVVKADVMCKGIATPALDRESAVELLSFFHSINDHWISWGFMTPPAGDIQITFWLSNGQSFLVQTWLGLERIGTDAGRRDLSRQERQTFRKLLPSCTHIEHSNNAPTPTANGLAVVSV